MPLERIRNQLLQDPNLYPDLAGRRPPNDTRQPISVASTSSSESSPAAPANKMRTHRNPVVLSDDDDESGDEVEELIVPPSKPALSLQAPQRTKSSNPNRPQYRPPPWELPPQTQKAAPIHVPSNRDLYYAQASRQHTETIELGDGEVLRVPNSADDNVFMSAAEAEKALRELMSGGMNENAEVDMEDSIVKGFKEGVALLPHQILGRAWMRDREDVTKKRNGGILADDMGLGKTIQTLTRIVEGRAKKSDKDDGWAATTLVICPLALVSQWASEIEKMTVNLNVLKHHGPSRTSEASTLQKYHVVVTTYDVVKSEYEAYNPSKDESKPKAKPKSKASTESDESEAEHFGRTIASKTAAKKAGKVKAPKDALFKVKWWRIVLDEAHNIKNVKTKGAKACCELDGKFRWCLTGTPMQNNVTEFYSLIKFLRIKPLNNWDHFNSNVAKPISSGRGAGRAMSRLQVVLKAIMLRRTKDQTLNGEKLITLPERTVNVVSCEFDPSERAFYDGLEGKMESIIEKIMAQSKGNSGYISVLLLLLRLRQSCNHPLLVAKDYKKDMEAVDPKSVPKGGDDRDDGDDLVAAFGQLGVTRKCQMCTIELTRENTGSGEWSTHCEGCIPLAIQAKRAEQERPSSAKIRKILQLLREINERSRGEEKTIIFSQFTSMLDLIEPFLNEQGIRFVRYDGSLSSVERERALDKIRNSTAIKVILISFKAGSTGLNLTACNNVILVDLWWNPALEDQAFDRAHRFGQTRDVNIFKLKIDNTVEDRILMLQDKKRALAAAALSGDKLKGMMRLGMDDLLALFRPGGRDDDEDEGY